MQSLENRFADRAKRKFENATESTAGNSGGGVGNAVELSMLAMAALGGLNEDDRAEADAALKQAQDDGFGSIAEDDAGNFKYAGVGIVNPLVVPPEDAPAPVNLDAAAAQAGNGGGWNGNLNGAAVEAATPAPAKAKTAKAVDAK